MPPVPPPLITLAAGVTQYLLAPRRRPGTMRRLAAAGLATGSVALMAGAAREFGRHRTSLDPMDPSRASTLVTSGPYRFTRNPMYVAGAGLLAANAVLRGGWATVLPVVADVALVDRFQVVREEEALRGHFGDAYAEYCRRVPRWLGPAR